MEITKKVSGTGEIKIQEEIEKILSRYKLSFDCPHCHKEINETHFDEKSKALKIINEKLRNIAEQEYIFRQNSYKQQWLKELIENKKYEDIQEVIKKTNTIEDLKKSNEGKDQIIEELKVKISGAYSSDKIENLARVKDLKKEIEDNKKQIEELKENAQPEIKLLKKTIEDLKVNIAKIQSSEEVEKLGRVKELKEKVDSYQKENEKLKLGNQPEIEKLRENIKNLEKELAETKINSEKLLAKATSADAINELKVVKELKEERDKYKKDNEELEKRNRDLVISKNKDSQRKGEDFEKWFYEELVKVFDGLDNIKDISKGQIGTGKRADFLQEVLTETEPKKIVGRIIYETKNTEKWDDNWVAKLEKDMQTHGADYGLIVATCEKDKVIKKAQTVDWKKKIYISDDNSNLFLVVKIMRELLINKHNLMKNDDNSVDKEQKLKKIEEWTIEKLPKYIFNLKKQLENQEKYANSIINGAEKIKKSKDEITKLTMTNINEEIKKLLN